MRGKDFWTERLPEDHPSFSAFFDLRGGMPAGALWGGTIVCVRRNFRRGLVGFDEHSCSSFACRRNGKGLAWCARTYALYKGFAMLKELGITDRISGRLPDNTQIQHISVILPGDIPYPCSRPRR